MSDNPKIFKMLVIFCLKLCFYFAFIIFLIQRNLLFMTIKPEFLPVYTKYDNIDIFLIDKASDRDIVFCHGSKISGKIFKLLLNLMSDKTGCNVISFNIRGMFNNRGVSSELGIRSECDTFINHYIKKRNKKLIAFGQSLGCSLAIQIASKMKLQNVILENPLLEYRSLIKAKCNWPLISYLIVDKWDNRVIKDIDNVMILLSDRDGLIPNEDGCTLSRLVKSKEVKYLKGSTHFDANRNPDFYDFINSYINN